MSLWSDTLCSVRSRISLGRLILECNRHCGLIFPGLTQERQGCYMEEEVLYE
jgi:hypothetical protein